MDEVERIARAVLGSPDVRVLEAQHGRGNQSWRVVDAATRAFVLKLGDPASAPKWRSAHRALDLAAREGVPVPELVYDGQHGARLVRVFTWVDGVNAEDSELDDAQEGRFVASLGRAVGALHRVHLDGFSSRQVLGPALRPVGRVPGAPVRRDPNPVRDVRRARTHLDTLLARGERSSG